MALTAEAYDTRRPPNRCSRCRALAERDAATALMALRNPACST
jgi:hypothetical protein